jgi:predicted DNA-binding transcriptional regulator AlpA
VNGSVSVDASMGKGGHSSKPAQRGAPSGVLAGGAGLPIQLTLPFNATPPIDPKPQSNGAEHRPQSPLSKGSVRLPALDRLTVREVLKIVPINRSTLFRWVNTGRFPKRHKAGGWLRSDVERWLTEHEGEER